MHIFTRAILLTTALILAFPAYAENWKIHQSDSELFQVRFPDNVKENLIELRIDNKNVVQAGQAVSTIDQRPLKNAVKSYIVKYEQTFAEELTDAEISELLADELDYYASHFSSLKGIQRKRKDVLFQNAIPGGELYIEYQDPTMGEQFLRARILFTRTAKIQHVISGPENVMDSLQSRKYFESIYAKEGYKRKPGTIKEDWEGVESPLGIFTAYLPQPVEPYVPKPHTVKNSNSIERISIQFYDPVWKERLYYNVYGYRLNKKLSEFDARTIMKNKHILRHRFSYDKVKFESMANKGFPVVQSEYGLKSSKEYPASTWVKLRAHYSGNHLLVHEVIGTPRHVRSSFMDNIIRSVEFHPERAKAPETPPAKAQPAEEPAVEEAVVEEPATEEEEEEATEDIAEETSEEETSSE